MSIRLSILAGVSTDSQAGPEKQSIPDQLKNCRAKIAALGGIETAGPFIMDGYSRTGYDSLEVAMREIPPLAQAIHAAEADQYDILLMDNFDRLGDLGFIVKTRFKKIRKQLHSVRQSGAIIEPHLYDPYTSEADDVAMYVEGIIQSYRINKIRRGWSIGVPNRARQGFHPTSLPFGYRATGKNQPAEQVADEVRLIREMVRLYLEGRTLQAILDAANASGIRPPRADSWNRTGVKRIILNQFYAGVTTFGKFKTVQGKRLPMPTAEWVSGTGQHQPLYGQETYLQILNEAERRAGRRLRTQTYALTGLLSCSVCQGNLHRHGKVDSPYPVNLTCRAIPPHVVIYYDIALKIVAQEFVKQLTHSFTPEAAENAPQALLERIRAQENLRGEVQSGYEAKIYTRAEAAHKISAIEAEIAKLQRQADRAAQYGQHRQTLQQLAQQDLSQLKDWIQQDDPATVNQLLTALCQTIEISPRYEINIHWR